MKPPFLKTEPPINSGYKPDVIKPEDYILGGESKFPENIVRSDGDWRAYTPYLEKQYNARVDVQACVSFAVTNAIEMLEQAQFGERNNYSDRYLAKMSGTTRYGNTIQNVLETVRNYSGLIPEEAWPFDALISKWDEYYMSIPFTAKLEGVKWIKTRELKHEWVLDGKRDDQRGRIKWGLKSSPLICGGYAWSEVDGKYVSTGNPNHCFLIIAENNEDYFTYALDTYEPHVKHLSKDYVITQAKRISITKRTSIDFQTRMRIYQGLIGMY